MDKHPFTETNPDYQKVRVHPPKEGTLYYDYKFAFHLHMLADDGEMTIRKKLDFLGESPPPKWVRVLVIDPELEFIDERLPRIDQLPFTLKIQSDVSYAKVLLRRFKPHIVAIQNLDEDSLRNVKAAAEEDTKFLLFKNDSGEKLTTTDKLTFPFIETIYKTFTDKVPINYDGHYFFKRSHKHAVARIPHVINIKGLNESYIFFECDDEIPEFTVFHMYDPFRALVTTIPNRMTDERLKKMYMGLMNYTSEDEVKKIRREVNAIFTKSKTEEAQKYKDELAQRNAKYREDEIKKKKKAEKKEK